MVPRSRGSILLRPTAARLSRWAQAELRHGWAAIDCHSNMQKSGSYSTNVIGHQHLHKAQQVMHRSCSYLHLGPEGSCRDAILWPFVPCFAVLYWLPNMLCLYTGPAVAAASASLRELHPVGKAIETGNLKVSDVHMIHYQIYGNAQGQPALVVHGGPGAGCYANHAYVHCKFANACNCAVLSHLTCRVIFLCQAFNW